MLSSSWSVRWKLNKINLNIFYDCSVQYQLVSYKHTHTVKKMIRMKNVHVLNPLECNWDKTKEVHTHLNRPMA